MSRKCVSPFCVVLSTKSCVALLWKLSNGVEGYTPKFCQAKLIQSKLLYLNTYNSSMSGLLYLGYENSLLVMLTLVLTGENKICNDARNSVVGKEQTAEITPTF